MLHCGEYCWKMFLNVVKSLNSMRVQTRKPVPVLEAGPCFLPQTTLSDRGVLGHRFLCVLQISKCLFAFYFSQA